MLALITQLVAMLLATAILVPLLQQRMTMPRAVGASACLAALSTAVLTMVLIFGPAGDDLYAPKLTVFIAKYASAFLVCWGTLALIALSAAGMVRIQRDRGVRGWRDRLLAAWCVFSLSLGALMVLIAHWVAGYFGDLDLDEVMFTLATGRDHNTNDLTMQIVTRIVAPFVCCVVIAGVIGLWRLRVNVGSQPGRVIHIGFRWVRRLGALAGTASLVLGGHMMAATLPVKDLLFPPPASSFIEENYVAPSSVKLTFPERKRNLIHIVVESLEATFYDSAHGGAMPQNLMPDLATLSDENINFSNGASRGGFYQVPGATYTTGGLVTLTTGVPHKTPTTDAAIQTISAFPTFTSLGEILQAHGYANELMTGANADFGSKRAFFTQHGDFFIFDHAYATSHGYLPQDYKVWWGYEDAKLYEFAKEQVTQLASATAPFYLMLESADTHFPDGYISPDATDLPFQEHYANAIYLSQKQVVDFVRWAQEQNWYADTTILITGDHESMETGFFERADLDPAYDRTVDNIIINPDPGVANVSEERRTGRKAATFDFFPTTLAALGVQIHGNRLGLGTNLFSDADTLMERDGVEEVQTSLQAPSAFYDAHVREAFKSEKAKEK